MNGFYSYNALPYTVRKYGVDEFRQTATAADVERSDRELARLFLEMFDVIGEQVVSDKGGADLA